MKELRETQFDWDSVRDAREVVGEFPPETIVDNPGIGRFGADWLCDPNGDWQFPMVVVIDTLSMALGGEDEKGPKAANFISNCLELPKPCYLVDNAWYRECAMHVIIIHHQPKTGNDFAGHRAIGANTTGLYRVHRSGKISDANRPYSGVITPQRVKGIQRPAPIRFEVDVVPVEGTERTAAILKDKSKAVSKKLEPIIEALRDMDDHENISKAEANECIDEVAENRSTRSRYRKELEEAGVLEPIEDGNGKVAFYRFHDIGAN